MVFEFWKGRRVFVTGHTGFKGSWLCAWLKILGANVTGFSLPAPTNPSMFDEAKIADGMVSEIGDIRDLDKLTQALCSSRPEIVFHFAAQSLVRRSYVDPVLTYTTNVIGTVHLLEAIRCQDSVRVLVNATTDKCYENKEWVWGYREEDRLGGHDPYSNSKACAELVTQAYRSSYHSADSTDSSGVRIATARAGNVIGGGDWAEDRLVPDLVKSFSHSNPVTIRMPNALRPWQHVLEPLRGYLMLAEKLYGENGQDFAEGWNFGPSESCTRPVGDLVNRFAEIWGDDASWQQEKGAILHEASLLRLDISKARKFLDWGPALSIDDTLQLTVAWYKAWQRGADMAKQTTTQIRKYSSSL